MHLGRYEVPSLRLLSNYAFVTERNLCKRIVNRIHKLTNHKCRRSIVTSFLPLTIGQKYCAVLSSIDIPPCRFSNGAPLLTGFNDILDPQASWKVKP